MGIFCAWLFRFDDGHIRIDIGRFWVNGFWGRRLRLWFQSRLQLSQHICHRLRSVGVVGLHHPHNELPHLVADRRRELEHRITLEQDVIALWQSLVGEQAIAHCPHGIEVGPSAHVLKALRHLLKRCVTWRVAGLGVGGCATIQLHLLAGPEVDEAHLLLVVNQHISGLHIQVPEAIAVHHSQRVQHLQQIVLHFSLRHWPVSALQPVGQRLTVHVVHHIVGRSVLVKQVVDGNDVRVVQTADATGLLAELGQLFAEHLLVLAVAHTHSRAFLLAVVHAAPEKLLDGDRLVKCGVGRQVGDAEAALPQHPFNPVFPALQQGSVG